MIDKLFGYSKIMDRFKNQRFLNREFVLTPLASGPNIAI